MLQQGLHSVALEEIAGDCHCLETAIVTASVRHVETVAMTSNISVQVRFPSFKMPWKLCYAFFFSVRKLSINTAGLCKYSHVSIKLLI